MAKTKAAAREAPEARTGSLAIEAALNSARTQTRLKITGASPGGHSVYVIAMTPEDKRIDIGTVAWDGERGDIIVPFVARQIRVMSDLDDPDRVETIIDVLEDFIEDIPQPEPEVKTTYSEEYRDE